MSEKRRTTLFAITLLLLVFGTGVYLSARLLLGHGVPVLQGARVAVLPVEGVLLSERELLRQLDSFRGDASVRALVIEIRSPGGSVGATQSLYTEIRRLREEDGRPVVAWMGDVAASGGYYIALAADSILALPGTVTGSIGVLMEFPNAEELMRKVGVGWEVVKSGEHKDLGSPTRPLTPEDRRILEGVVEEVWEQFVQAVAENRGLERATVVPLADGRIFTGARAVELGLADGLGTLREAVEVAWRMAGLEGRPATLRPRERRLDLWDLVTGVSEGAVRRLLGGSPLGGRVGPRLLYEWR